MTHPPAILVLDTETTGLPLHPEAPLEKQPKIIEFGCALLDPKSGNIIDELNVLINPQEPLEAIITKITGLTDDQLRDAKPFGGVVDQLRPFFGRAGIVVAHNLPFDRTMMRNELARSGISDFPWPPIEVCTVGLFKEIWGRNPKLTELYEYLLCKPLAQTHRALDDVHALVEIIQHDRLWEVLS